MTQTAKTVFEATAPNGERFTRKSAHVYTHAVLARDERGWGVLGFRANLSAAENLLRRWQKHFPETLIVEARDAKAGKHVDVWYKYDTEFWNGVRECIAEGEDAKPALEFCKKYKLPDFEEDVRDAMKQNVEAV